MYEVITWGKMPYAGLEKENTLRALSNKRRLPLPKDGLVQCPVEYYNIILQCWHRIPECRLTFEFLGDFLYEFDVSVETDNLLKDERFKDMYMNGTLKNEPELKKKLKDSKECTYVNSEKEMDVYTSNIIDVVHNIERSDKKELKNRGNVAIIPGFNVTALYDFKAGLDDEISFYHGDILTNIEAVDKGWWRGTTSNGERGMFPANYVELCENAYAEVTKF